MRIDKYIWCVRLYKTRSLSGKDCGNEKVRLNEDFVKGSKEVKVGDKIAIKHGPVWKRYEVLEIPKSRIGAKIVVDHIKEITDAEDVDILERIALENKLNRQQGVFGRPTKKVRRTIDRFKRSLDEYDED